MSAEKEDLDVRIKLAWLDQSPPKRTSSKLGSAKSPCQKLGNRRMFQELSRFYARRSGHILCTMAFTYSATPTLLHQTRFR
jgi:hypothetical protein